MLSLVGGRGLEPLTSSASRKRSSSELTTQQKRILQILRLFVNNSVQCSAHSEKWNKSASHFGGFHPFRTEALESAPLIRAPQYAYGDLVQRPMKKQQRQMSPKRLR